MDLHVILYMYGFQFFPLVKIGIKDLVALQADVRFQI